MAVNVLKGSKMNRPIFHDLRREQNSCSLRPVTYLFQCGCPGICEALSLLSIYQDMVLGHNNKVKRLNFLPIPKNTCQMFEVNTTCSFLTLLNDAVQDGVYETGERSRTSRKHGLRRLRQFVATIRAFPDTQRPYTSFFPLSILL